MKHLLKTLILSIVLLPLLAACGDKSETRYIAVKKGSDKSWSIIDTEDGTVIADNEFANRPSPIVDGVFYVKNKKDKYEFYNIDDINNPFSDSYISATYFNDGRAIVCKEKDKEFILIDKNGEEVASLSKKIKKAGAFENGMAIVVNEDGKRGFINTDGEIIIKMDYDIAEPYSKDGYAIVGKKDGNVTNYSLIDKDGEKQFSFKDDKYVPKGEFINGSIAVEKGDNIVYLNKDGENILKVGDNKSGAYGMYNDMTIFAKDGEYGVKDDNGEIILKAKYGTVVPIKNGNFVVEKDDKWMILDKEGEQLTEDDYAEIEIINKDRYLVRNKAGGKQVLIDAEGKEISDESFAEVYYEKNPTNFISRDGSGGGDSSYDGPNMDEDSYSQGESSRGNDDENDYGSNYPEQEYPAPEQATEDEYDYQ